MSEIKVSEKEILSFKYFVSYNENEKKINDLIHPMIFMNDIPHEIIAKFFVRTLTEVNSFRCRINELLMQQNLKDYLPFVKIMFEGLSNKSLLISEDDYLYRCTNLEKDKIDKIIELFNNSKKSFNNNAQFPFFILYSRCFLSFSKDENIAGQFIEKTDNKFLGILLKLHNDNIIKKNCPNADIEFLSAFTYEKEVLFFPYSTFCLKNIYEGKFQDKNCIIIELDYLGKYNDILKRHLKSDKNFKKTFFSNFNNQNYSNEIIESNLLKGDKTEIFDAIKNKIFEKYSIFINEIIDDEEKQNENIVINFKEKINIGVKKESNDIVIKNDFLDLIHIKEKKNVFSLVSIKPEKMEYIWNGDYNSEDKKNGIGKEYDFDDNIVFE